MKKYLILVIGSFLTWGISSCASTKKNKEGKTKEERKIEKDKKEAAQELENNKPPVKETSKGPVQNIRTQTEKPLLEKK